MNKLPAEYRELDSSRRVISLSWDGRACPNDLYTYWPPHRKVIKVCIDRLFNDIMRFPFVTEIDSFTNFLS